MKKQFLCGQGKLLGLKIDHILLKFLLHKKNLIIPDIHKAKLKIVKICFLVFVYLFLEMKSVEHDSGQLNELQKQKSELIQELFTLQRELKGITFMS